MHEPGGALFHPMRHLRMCAQEPWVFNDYQKLLALRLHVQVWRLEPSAQSRLPPTQPCRGAQDVGEVGLGPMQYVGRSVQLVLERHRQCFGLDTRVLSSN